MRNLLVLLLLLCVPACCDQARVDVDAYYRDHRHVPPYEKAVAQLGGAHGQASGAYLAALLQTLYDDEHSGRSALTPSPFFGVGATMDARELRTGVAGALAYKAHGDYALDAIAFLLDKDTDVDNQRYGIQALKRITGPRADAMIGGLLQPPHPNRDVLVTALHLVALRHLQACAPQVSALCASYRTPVRKAAHQAALVLGLSNVPDEQPGFPAAISDQLALIAAMPAVDIPVGAPWVRIRYKDRQESAWVLRHGRGKLHVLNQFGIEQDIDEAACKVEPRTLEQDADLLLQIRSRYDKATFEQKESLMPYLSNDAMGGWPKSGLGFDAPSLTVPEALVGVWLWQRGRTDKAAALLYPRIDSLPDDRWLSWTVRDMIGAELHQAMLDAFAGSRNYPEAIRLAQHLQDKAFDGYPYQPRAQELESQLLQRQDDFHALRLPTPHEWALWRKGKSRPDQIQYLVARLRLLNCFQMGQPGGLECDQQYRDPHPAPMILVIDPVAELMSLHLSRRELALLVPSLADEDFFLGYSYFRDFFPQRELHRVNELVRDVINAACHRERVHLEDFYRKDAAARQAWLNDLTAWCRH